MSDLVLGSGITVLGGEDLDLTLRNLQNDVQALMGPTRLTLYTGTDQLAALGLNTNTMTLKDLALALPIYSTTALAVDTNQAYASTLPLPYITQASSPTYMGGVILVDIIGGDYRRVNFTFRNRDLVATCSYLEYEGSTVSQWMFQSAPQLNRRFPSASSWGNLISNIWMPGTYYFTTAEMNNFTDKPTDWLGGGAYIEVRNKDNVPTGDRMYRLISNGAYPYEWTRQTTQGWRNVPLLNNFTAGDASLRLGDMRVNANGTVSMRTSSTSVGQIVTQ